MRLDEIFDAPPKRASKFDHRTEVETDGADDAVKKALALLKEHCSDALKNIETPIWRGTKKAFGMVYQVHGDKPGTEGRQSANTSNYYTMLMDKFLPTEYPRRSKSIICGNHENKEYAESMGTLYAVFPYNGVKIGMTSDYDLWDTQEFKIGNSFDENDLTGWNLIFKNNNLSQNSWEEFKHDVEEKMKNPGEIRSIMMKTDGTYSNVEDVFEKAYSPSNLHLTLHDPKSIYSVLTPREVWISGPCIMVRALYFKDLVTYHNESNK